MKNLNLLNFSSAQEDDRTLILKGLINKNQKTINSKFFYDDVGSELFEKITKLKEYYPTKAEINILEKKFYTKQFLSESSSIIEFGSGSNKKIKKLINGGKNLKEYIPIDISKDFLYKNAKNFAKIFPKTKVTAICAAFNQISEIKEILDKKNNKIGFFPGSTIGNFIPSEAENLLKSFSLILGSGSHMIIGVDLIKSKKVLENAYNDSKGITARFNSNILRSVNSIVGGKLDKKNFKHHAFFNDKEKRIEMHLISKVKHSVNILNQIINFKKGESIHTENSYKYTLEGFSKLSKNSGFRISQILKDENNLFSIFVLKVK